MDASYTNIAVGFPVAFVAETTGKLSASVWDFGDGTTLTNEPLTRHPWIEPGLYDVRLTAYSDTYPEGMATTLAVHVSEAIHYVDAASSTPQFPYTTWASAATNIQQAIDAGTLPGRLVLVTDGVYATGSVMTNGPNRVA
jgi:PKD repeat protein